MLGYCGACCTFSYFSSQTVAGHVAVQRQAVQTGPTYGMRVNESGTQESLLQANDIHLLVAYPPFSHSLSDRLCHSLLVHQDIQTLHPLYYATTIHIEG